MSSSPFAQFNERLDASRSPAPKVGSFHEFLATQARVKLSDGSYGPYSFKGREGLEQVVETIDLILGSKTGRPLEDSIAALCGGAQIGKSILELNLMAYLTGCAFRSAGLYLPDDDLVEGMVDTKFRPDVIDQVEWFAEMMQLGKSVNKSGKVVNRKGAFMVTDPATGRKAQGMVRGMGKIPTSFSMDVAMEDEKDDIPEKRSKFLKGRMSASDLRFKLSIGTQRIHGAGQNREFEQGSQGVQMFACPECGHDHCLEEEWPGIARVALTGAPSPEDPRLTWEGDFKQPGSAEVAAEYDPEAHYYFACVQCGAPLDRFAPRWEHRRPERVKLRKWSWRLPQIAFGAYPVRKFISEWQDAVRDPDCMIVFCCDVLALPRNTAQDITPAILERSRGTGTPFEVSLTLAPGCAGFAGLDMGDRCWFFAREVASRRVKRVRRVERISSGDVVKRAVALFHTMGLSGLFIDSAPLITQARQICWAIHGLEGITWPRIKEPEKARIALPGGLTWDGEAGRWIGLRAAVVQFTKRTPGSGITHALGVATEDLQDKFYPIIQCNRFDAIDRAVQEFLTAEEGIVDVQDGQLRTEPVMRLPQRGPGAPAILETLDSHLVVGSQRAKRDDGTVEQDYIDKAENHFMLADAYSALAEQVCAGAKAVPFAYEAIEAEQGERLLPV